MLRWWVGQASFLFNPLMQSNASAEEDWTGSAVWEPAVEGLWTLAVAECKKCFLSADVSV